MFHKWSDPQQHRQKNYLLITQCFIWTLLVGSLLFHTNVFAELTTEYPDDGTKLETPFSQDMSNSIFNSSGVFTKGTPIKIGDKQILPISYKGALGSGEIKNTQKDVTYTTNNPKTGFYRDGSMFVSEWDIMKGDSFYLKKFGYYNGHLLRLKITADKIDLRIGLSALDGGVQVGPVVKVDNPEFYESDMEYEIVDEDDNPISDPNLLLLATKAFYLPDAPTIKGVDYANHSFSGNKIYNTIGGTAFDSLIFSTPLTNIEQSDGTNSIKLLTEKKAGYNMLGNGSPKRSVSYLYQSGKKMRVTTQKYMLDNKKYFQPYGIPYEGMFVKSLVPYPIPYGYSMVDPSINDDRETENSYKAKVNIYQILPEQPQDEFYPNDFTVTIDLNDQNKLLDLSKVKASDFKMFTAEKEETRSSFMPKKELTADHKLILKFSQDNLKNLKETMISFEGLIPLAQTEEIYKNLTDDDHYIQINKIKAKNNKHPKEDMNNLKVAPPAPDATPEPISVIEGASSTKIAPSNLVKEASSRLPNDEAVVGGFKEDKTFNTIGKDFLEVEVRSKRIPSAKRYLKVPVTVISKDSPQLADISILPEADKEASSKAELTYNPTYKQSLLPKNKANDPSSATFNEVDLFLSYGKGLKVDSKDFVLTDKEGKAIDPSLYQLTVTNQQVQVKILSKGLSSSLKANEITIQQHSKLDTETKSNDILTYYDKEAQRFNFPIEGSNKYKIKSEDPFLVSEVVKNQQTIHYKPKLTAEPVTNLVVEPGSEVKDPQDYVKEVSQPDFAFDKNQVTFKEKPDFSTPGEKDFTVIIKSDAFGNSIEVPVSVKVVKPEVQMSIKQVYKNRNEIPIYSDLIHKTPVDNSEDHKSVKIGDNLSSVLTDFEMDQKDFNLHYDNYSDDYTGTSPDIAYKTETEEDGVQMTTTVPEHDFTLILEYEGTYGIEVSWKGTSQNKVDFGTTRVALINGQETYGNNQADNYDNYVNFTDTTLNKKSYIAVGIPEGENLTMTDENGKAHSFIGGLFIKKNKEAEKLYLSEAPQKFFQQDPTNLTMKSDFSMNMGLYQNTGNKKGSYSGKVLWSYVLGE